MTKEHSLHPDSKRSLDDNATKLLSRVSARPRETIPVDPGSFPIERPVTSEVRFTGPIREALVNSSGQTVAKMVASAEGNMGLFGDDYASMENLGKQFQKNAKLQNKVSIEFIVDKIFDWVMAEHRAKTPASMSDFVAKACHDVIDKFEITIPINELYIESEFSFGRVGMTTLQAGVFDELDQAAEKHDQTEKERAAGQQWRQKLRQRLQGRAAAVVTLEAERIRATQIAIDEATHSLGVLRLYHPAHLAPEATSYCTLLGHEHQITELVFARPEGRLPFISERVIGYVAKDWCISNQNLAEYRSMGFENLNDALKRDEKSQFEERVIDATLLYSEGVLKHSIRDRLMYYLAALESLLLKDRNEPLQQNIGDRLAFFIGENLEERRAVVANVKFVYEQRSSFLHHGEIIKLDERMDKFCHNLWLFFVKVAMSLRQYQTMAEFWKAIEDIKYSC